MSSNSTEISKQLQEDAAKSPTDVPLMNHVSDLLDDKQCFSPRTVSAWLESKGSSHSTAKGTAIAGFNANHSGNWSCPFGSTLFKPDAKTGFAKYLHLGTTRVWNADGSINEARWEQFVDFVTQGQSQDRKYLTLSALKRYLDHCYTYDPQESDTNRNTKSLTSSGFIQATAATQAWNEVFDRLTGIWVMNAKSKAVEPAIFMDVVRLFFEDSRKAFVEAESKRLPVPKPAKMQEEAETLGTSFWDANP